jgi:hypothetical protein
MAGKTAHTDHRRNSEELLSQLAGLLYEDMFTQQVRRNRRRRTVARQSIIARLNGSRGIATSASLRDA